MCIYIYIYTCIHILTPITLCYVVLCYVVLNHIMLNLNIFYHMILVSCCCIVILLSLLSYGIMLHIIMRYAIIYIYIYI